jgi:aerobic-type carbon monoxide dehydrogenase small subunit (CoxS/CutS family)
MRKKLFAMQNGYCTGAVVMEAKRGKDDHPNTESRRMVPAP